MQYGVEKAEEAKSIVKIMLDEQWETYWIEEHCIGFSLKNL